MERVLPASPERKRRGWTPRLWRRPSGMATARVSTAWLHSARGFMIPRMAISDIPTSPMGGEWTQPQCNTTLGPTLSHTSYHPRFVYIYITYIYDLRFVSGSGDKTLRIWNTSGECEHVLTGHDGAVLTVATNPQGWILSGGQDRTILIWTQNQSTGSWSRAHVIRSPFAEERLAQKLSNHPHQCRTSTR